MTFTTADTKRKKSEARFMDVQRCWNQLMMDLTLEIAGRNEPKEEVVVSEPTNEPVKVQKEKSCEESATKLCIQGDKYLFGYGVNRSYDVAFKKYSAAAKQGLPEASNMLGSMYEYGLGRDSDMTLALQYYLDAAKQHYADAENNIGRLHEMGKGVPKNFELAVEYYSRAAEQKHADALTNLGFMAENGMGMSVDIIQAEQWYRDAAETSEYARAENYLGSLYYHGKGQIEQDFNEAVQWFRKAAEQGNTHALNNLGICYEEGAGVSRDYAMAKEYYKKSASGNHPSAANNLGYIYLLEKNYEDAIRWFHLASALGSSDALYNLGTVYESGVAHPKGKPDIDVAIKYYSEAASKGYSKAQVKVRELSA